jgi:hypothetical protein
MKVFVCSLCRGGVLGGALYLDEKSLTYRTNKLTVDPQFRNLVMPLENIRSISWEQIVLPIATIQLKHGGSYKFIIFNKSGFEKSISNFL